jgi:hypothetical protein
MITTVPIDTTNKVVVNHSLNCNGCDLDRSKELELLYAIKVEPLFPY